MSGNNQSQNIILEKTFQFSVKIVKLIREIQRTQKEFILTKQICRSGTSIGANTEEAMGAESRSDFVHKLSIAYKESRETEYWLRLLYESELITPEIFEPIFKDCKEISRILYKIVQTTKNKNKKNTQK